MAKKLPKVINKSPQEIADCIDELKNSSLRPLTVEFAIECIQLAAWLPDAIRAKKITIRQLQKLLFGNNRATTAKPTHKNNSEHTTDSEGDKKNNDDASHASPPAANQAKKTRKAKGHGRTPRSAYANPTVVTVQHDSLTAGNKCPECVTGKLYDYPAGALVRVVGQPMATVYHLDVEKLRCGLCGTIFTAPLPPNFSHEKYDACFKAWVAIQKYYMGVPFHRQAMLQLFLGFKLSASVQFELSEQVADCGYPVVSALEKIAANGKKIHNDDTYVKILSVMNSHKIEPDKTRTGMYTSCLIGATDEHTIALYYAGVQHAGENLSDVLQQRTHEKPIIQMCDALSANIPKGIKTIVCHCLSHGVRKFRDLLEFYPEPCVYVITMLGKVFEHDEATKEMSDEERFNYHRCHSKPLMLALYAWLRRQLRDSLVEPNSPLGKAIKYLLKNWKKLRRFLVIPGAPIDNNIVERALKIPIRVRKTAMFYKTEHGAKIAGILMSLTHTACLAHENPLDYLTALQKNKSHVFKDPAAWVPWRYRATQAQLNPHIPAVHSLQSCANPAASEVSRDHPGSIKSVI